MVLGIKPKEKQKAPSITFRKPIKKEEEKEERREGSSSSICV